MNLATPKNPIFAHSENKIYANSVDGYLDCTFEITTYGTVKTFTNTIHAYNGNCEIDLVEILKIFYYRYEQVLPISLFEILNGANSLNGGELKITLIDASNNIEVLNYFIINGALQLGETFNETQTQTLNQIQIDFLGFPRDRTVWDSENQNIFRSVTNNFPKITKCTGIYIAWLNKYGAYDYYLFDGYSEMDINSSDIEKFRGYSLGKKSNRVIKIRANVIEDLKKQTIQKISPNNTAKKITEALLSIVESPEVYIFRISNKTFTSGGDFNADFNNDFLIDPYFKVEGKFIKVKSVSGSNKLRFKFNTTLIEFDLMLPDEYNIRAI